MNKDFTNIIFYDGCYGETIRVDVQNVGWLKSFLNVLLKLKYKKIKELDFDSLQNTSFNNLKNLKIIPKQGTSLMFNDEQLRTFIWGVDSETLIYIITTVIRFIKDGNPGHHYYYEKDGLIIEFAYLE